jgi:beta-glucosidase
MFDPIFDDRPAVDLRRRFNTMNSRAWSCARLVVLALATCGALFFPDITALGQVAAAAGRSDAVADKRASELLKEMTPQEKIGQLCQQFAFSASASLEQRLKAGELGSALFVSDPAQINKIQRMAVEESRLHIPLLFGLDVIHGFRTVFPVPIAMAASWNPSIAERAQGVAAQEARAAGVHWTFAPMVDIARDPRWGRIVEGAGEDPYLGSAMAAAQVRGFQGQYVGASGHIVATVKHFAGYGAAEGGRDYDSVDISDDQLWNVYLPPFKSAVDAGVGTVMSAYMDLNGVPATGNRWLLQDVLRNQWGFKGFVVSDADAVKNLRTHGFAKDTADAALRGFNAGVNMEMSAGPTAYGSTLPDAYKNGQMTDEELDNAVRPVLLAKIKLGLFEHPYVDETLAKQVLEEPSHRTESLRAAEQSAVLLRNEGGLLPLKPSEFKRIAVIGPLADSKTDITGSWVFANDGDETVTVLEALRKRMASDAQVSYAQGVQIARKFPSPFDGLLKNKPPKPWTEQEAARELTNAVALAQQSDLVIMVLGEGQSMSGEGASRSTLELPNKQEQLLESIVATGKPIALVLLNGRPLDISWATEHVPAILECWYPGTQGGNAIANLLYGQAVPGGKLPFTWPRSVGQVPIFYAHNTTHQPANQNKRYWNEESTPLYPFGFGLSYTTFGFSNLRLNGPSVKKGESLNVSVDVENTGDIAGDEVVQLYMHQQYGTSSRPVRELKGFRRIPLAAHEKKTVQFTLNKEDRVYWSSATRSWVEDASQFDIWVGADSTATLHETFSVTQ